jgi:hypothetical protein
MVSVTLDVDELVADEETDEIDRVKKAVRGLFTAIKAVAANADVDTEDKVELFDHLTADARTGRRAIKLNQPPLAAITAAASSNGSKAITPPALGGSTDSVDSDLIARLRRLNNGNVEAVVSWNEDVYGALGRVSDRDQAEGMGIAMRRVAERVSGYETDKTGTLLVGTNLATTERKLSGLKPFSDALDAIKDPTQKRKRTDDALQALNGTPTVTPPDESAQLKALRDERDALKQQVTDLTAERDALQIPHDEVVKETLDRVAKAVRKRTVGAPILVVANLDDDAVEAFKLKRKP